MPQIRRSFASIIATASMVTAAWVTGGVALAADVVWSVGIASPGYRAVASTPPAVVLHHPVAVHHPVMLHHPVAVHHAPVRAYRPVVLHVEQPQVIYARAPVFVHDHAVPVMLVRDVGRHGYVHKHKHKFMHNRHHRHGHQPGNDGHWGHN